MKNFKDLPLNKDLEVYAKKNLPNNPDTTSTPKELKKKMLYGSIDESTNTFSNKFRQLYRTNKLMTFKQWIKVIDDLIDDLQN
tara:strand:+ start:2046 stop:2294 length:249 start_codon:yes stop_codon:yes gene_type:complete